MAFKIALKPTYKVKVVVETPNDNGRLDKSDFMADFTRADMNMIDELRQLTQKEVVERVLVGWSGLLDENNEAVPFSEANRDALLGIPQAFAALAQGFWDSIYKAREKN